MTDTTHSAHSAPEVVPDHMMGFEFAAPRAIAAQALILPTGFQDGVQTASSKQVEAWNYYGSPTDGETAAVGEVRYTMGWISAQCGRVKWTVFIDDELVDPVIGEGIVRLVSSPSVTVQLATNLVVAGQLDYTAWNATDSIITEMTELGVPIAGNGDTRWLVVSMIDQNRRVLLNDSQFSVMGLWSHPAQPTHPDPPMLGVLDVLEEITQLQNLAHSQNNSRIAQMSLLLVASELSMALSARGSSGSFSQDLQDAILAPIRDPRSTGAAPIILTGPADVIERGGAAKAVQVGQPYDSRLDQRMEAAIRRLAWGLPIPPEILLGMTSTNRATAFQIEEATYRGHVEPVCAMIGTIYGNAATKLMDSGVVRFEPDPSDLLARRHSVADVKDAWDRGLVSASWVREVLGIPEEAAAQQGDVDLLNALRSPGGSITERQVDPADSAADESVRASATVPPELVASLRGACEMAVRRTRERVGAKARSALRNSPDLTLLNGIPNTEVATILGCDGVRELMDLEMLVLESLESLATWWESELRARDTGQLFTMSVTTPWSLREALGQFIIDGLDQELQPVPDDVLAEVTTSASRPTSPPLP